MSYQKKLIEEMQEQLDQLSKSCFEKDSLINILTKENAFYRQMTTNYKKEEDQLQNVLQQTKKTNKIYQIEIMQLKKLLEQNEQQSNDKNDIFNKQIITLQKQKKYLQEQLNLVISKLTEKIEQLNSIPKIDLIYKKKTCGQIISNSPSLQSNLKDKVNNVIQRLDYHLIANQMKFILPIQ